HYKGIGAPLRVLPTVEPGGMTRRQKPREGTARGCERLVSSQTASKLRESHFCSGLDSASGCAGSGRLLPAGAAATPRNPPPGHLLQTRRAHPLVPHQEP